MFLQSDDYLGVAFTQLLVTLNGAVHPHLRLPNPVPHRVDAPIVAVAPQGIQGETDGSVDDARTLL